MPGNLRWPHRVKRPDEYRGDRSYSKMPIGAVEPQAIHQIRTRALLSWMRHSAEHKSVSHTFVFFLSANAELVTMFPEMNLPLPRIHKRHDSYDISSAQALLSGQAR
jgi:hypothetical protein